MAAQESVNGRIGKWQLLASSILGMLAGVLTFRDQLEKVFDGKTAGYFHFFIDLIRVEEIGVLIIFFLFTGYFLSVSKSAIAHLWGMIAHGQSWRTRRKGLFITAVVITLGCTFLYHLTYLTLGKRIFISEYDRLIGRHSANDFKNGKPEAARARLQVCVIILSSPTCQDELEMLEERMNLAKQMRRLLSELPNGNMKGRLLLIQDISYLENNPAFLEEEAKLMEADAQRSGVDYMNSLDEVVSGNLAEAKSKLETINKRFPGFGDAHILAKELADILRGLSDETPYTKALRDLGPDKFAELVSKSTYAFTDTLKTWD